MSDQRTDSESVDSSNNTTPSGDDEEYNPVPARGTGSVAHNEPLEGDNSNPNTQMIEDESGDLYPALKVQHNGKIRVYALTDDVREHYEGTMEASHEDDENVSIWWEGTELVCEYMGHTRHKEMMKREKDNPQTQDEEMQQGLEATPPYPDDPIDVPQKSFDTQDMNRHMNDEESFHDKGLYPTYQFERYDLTKAVSERPLQFEDTLMLLDQEPIEQKSLSQDISGDIPDIRNDDMNDTTLDKGARGNRYNL